MVNASFSKLEEQKSGEKLSPDQVFDLVLAEKKIGPPSDGDLLDASAELPKPVTEIFQSGQTVAEPVAEVPEVVVEESQAVAPMTTEAEVREEIKEGVSPKVAETDGQIEKVIEAVPEVVAEERVEAAAVQEPTMDTAPPDAASNHDEFASRQGEAKTPEAAAIEEVWSPLEE